jgi:hypothetical protein
MVCLLSVQLDVGERAAGQEHFDNLDFLTGGGSWVDAGEYGDPAAELIACDGG